MSPTPRAAAAYAASRPMLPGAKWQPNAVKTSALHRATMRGMIPRDLFQVFGSILQSGSDEIPAVSEKPMVRWF
jgi:hypothetical protein